MALLSSVTGGTTADRPSVHLSERPSVHPASWLAAVVPFCSHAADIEL